MNIKKIIQNIKHKIFKKEYKQIKELKEINSQLSTKLNSAEVELCSLEKKLKEINQYLLTQPKITYQQYKPEHLIVQKLFTPTDYCEYAANIDFSDKIAYNMAEQITEKILPFIEYEQEFDPITRNHIVKGKLTFLRKV